MSSSLVSSAGYGRLTRAAFAGVVALGLASCSSGSSGGLALDDAVPDQVPDGTSLSVSIKTTRLQLEATGQLADLPFTVSDWPDVSAGPDVIQAFRGNAVDLATNAAIPPIQAHATGLDAKIVAVREKEQPQYRLATAPGSDITELPDLRGKKIAFSPGQAQGVVILRTLKAQGLTTKDVQLVELPSPQFLTALQSKQVDIAPLSEPTVTKYLNQYGPDGATALATDAVDALTVLWAPVEVLQDPAKAAAIKAFIPFWARGEIWAWENQDAWIQKYYVESEQVSAEDGKRIVASVGQRPVYPANWDAAVEWTQDTVQLLSDAGYFSEFDANELFDRRFETIAADAVPAEYRGGVQR
ncbi:ABC transporter substrate-binding protein [Rhodococcus sp. NM-2]|jgi:sulfonate transport system substrate-binding protein|uniref:ABC transporter substrate-binding protein n=1 Tax=Rhodococcus TaxID=1827 RepID=UPI0024756533|nr:ABC transporter substrate-binding protein [Rhodococcus opacus]MDH6285260.1 sulfonate transport system substrate-binding protein [Rhodococcus opacus]